MAKASDKSAQTFRQGKERKDGQNEDVLHLSEHAKCEDQPAPERNALLDVGVLIFGAEYSESSSRFSIHRRLRFGLDALEMLQFRFLDLGFGGHDDQCSLGGVGERAGLSRSWRLRGPRLYR